MAELSRELRTVLLVDQRERWSGDTRPSIDAYLAAAPELTTDRETVLDLIYQEIVLSEEAGERPDVEEYVRRFPQWATELRRQFEVHAALPRFEEANDEASEEPAPLELPRYEGFAISEEIGRGSFGVVYRAWEKSLNRAVALKVLGDYGGEPNPEERERFVSEAKSAARLKHPNIVRIHAVGSDTPRPYLCLELVEGGTLAAFLQETLLRGNPQPLHEAAELAATLADAVDHAHQRGIVHCDLKPQNVLLDYRSDEIRRRATDGAPAVAGRPSDVAAAVAGRPSITGSVRTGDDHSRDAARPPALRLADFQAKITDFGLARDLELDNEPAFHRLAGTLPYMAPEQLSDRADAVGPATDIYGLGAILFEMLTGRPPHTGATRLDLYLAVRDRAPPAASTLRPEVPADLDAICRKCLTRDPAARYAKAGDLASDLRRFLDGREVSARPLRFVERIGRGLRRNRVAASLSLLLAAATVAGVAAMLLRPEAAESATLRYMNEFLSARQAFSGDDAGRATAILDATDPAERSIEFGLLRRKIAGKRVQFPTDQKNVSCLVYAPDGRTAAVADLIEPISLVDTADGKTRHVLSGHTLRLARPVFSPDGRSLATAGIDGDDGYARVWNVETGKLTRKIGPLAGSGLAVAFIDDTRLRTLAPSNSFFSIATKPLVIETWDIATGNRVDKVEGPPTASVVFGPIGILSADGSKFAWAPTPTWFYGGGKNGEIVIGDALTGKVLDTVPVARGPVHRMIFRPDGLRIAIAMEEAMVRVLDFADARNEVRLEGHADAVIDVSFSADGNRVATGSRDQTVKLWDAQTGHELATPGRHTRLVQAVGLNPTGSTLLSSAESGLLSRWDLNAPGFASLVEDRLITVLALGADGTRLISTDVLHRTMIRDTGDLNGQALLSRRLVDVAMSRDGKRLAAVDSEGKLHVTPEGGAIEKPELVVGVPPLHAGGATALAWSADGRKIAGVAADKKTVLVFEVRDSQKRLEIATPHAAINGLAFRAHGEQLATIGLDDPTVRLWSTADGRAVREIPAEGPLRAVVYRAMGDDLATIPVHGLHFEVWNSRTGERRLRIAAHKLPVTALAATSDGKRWLSGGADKLIKIFDAETGTELYSLEGPSGPVRRVALSADGRTIAAAAEHGHGSKFLLWRVD